MICLTVFKRTTPVAFSEPASLGSVSAKKTFYLTYSRWKRMRSSYQFFQLKMIRKLEGQLTCSLV